MLFSLWQCLGIPILPIPTVQGIQQYPLSIFISSYSQQNGIVESKIRHLTETTWALLQTHVPYCFFGMQSSRHVISLIGHCYLSSMIRYFTLYYFHILIYTIFAVSVVSQLFKSFCQDHCDAVVQILRYIKNALDKHLIYEDKGNTQIIGYFYAD